MPEPIATIEEALRAVRRDGRSVKRVPKNLRTREVLVEAVKNRYEAFNHIDDSELDEETILEMLKVQQHTLWGTKIRSEAINDLAVRLWSVSLSYIKKQTRDLCLLACRHHGYSLRYAKFQDDEICMAAVMNYGPALEFVKNQTEDIVLMAVWQNCQALRHAKIHTPLIYLAAAASYASYEYEPFRFFHPEIIQNAIDRRMEEIREERQKAAGPEKPEKCQDADRDDVPLIDDSDFDKVESSFSRSFILEKIVPEIPAYREKAKSALGALKDNFREIFAI